MAELRPVLTSKMMMMKSMMMRMMISRGKVMRKKMVAMCQTPSSVQQSVPITLEKEQAQRKGSVLSQLKEIKVAAPIMSVI